MGADWIIGTIEHYIGPKLDYWQVLVPSKISLAPNGANSSTKNKTGAYWTYWCPQKWIWRQLELSVPWKSELVQTESISTIIYYSYIGTKLNYWHHQKLVWRQMSYRFYTKLNWHRLEPLVRTKIRSTMTDARQWSQMLNWRNLKPVAPSQIEFSPTKPNGNTKNWFSANWGYWCHKKLNLRQLNLLILSHITLAPS